jgi:hypothetical protein
MSGGGKFPCPFCVEENHPDAAVCRVCHRDIVIPAVLRIEHEELSRKREQLKLELGRAKARLGPGSRWFGI